MNIHLGCGKRYIENWVNIDIVSDDDRVLNDNVSILSSIPDESVDIIYASHVLEHFGRHQVEDVVKVWFRKLKKNGILRVAVPDFEAVCKRYETQKDMSEIIGFLSGGQRNDYDYHKIVFDFSSLSNLLKKIGLKDIVKYDWRMTDHSHVDDYSQSYLPHMDKERGMLMSLNVEARKV